ncbi:MAG TPA: AraC family transcriptional regulator [Flavipsychrobacter sp.]|nr:AraC family transcriptional regulator [Flavipsychrobacter sp.]
MRLYIKYMVSLRCKMIVAAELQKLGIKHVSIELGVLETLEDISGVQQHLLKESLAKSGLELLDDKRAILVEKIKNVVIEMIHYSDDLPLLKYSEHLSQKLDYNYTYLANVFSEVKGITIQQYIIINKIEKAKELILYDDLNLTEIAYRLNYSSVAHLSRQFKKITGLTPSFFKNIRDKKRIPLEDL